MRRLLLFFCALSVTVLRAQVSDADNKLALDLVRANSGAAGLSANDLQNLLISSTYKTMDGLQMVYAQQSFRGIPVYNQLQVMAFQQGRLVSNAGGRIPGMEQSINPDQAIPAVSAVTAVETALRHTKTVAKEAAVPIYSSPDGYRFEFGKLGASYENIKADLLWYPLENEKGIRLAWQVFVAPVGSSDYWLIRVDAITNEVIGQMNLTITCNWNKEGHTVEQHLNETHRKAAANNYVVRQPVKRYFHRPDVISSVTYRVVKYPAESPIHPGGTPSLHTDPWLMAGNPAASLGWHNDGTTEHDSTRGNNVWAQEDRDNSNATTGRAAVSTTPQPNLTLDFTYDFTLAPTDPASDNQKAAITNLFYWNNIMHDISYIYGFDESSGNFQQSNQGRGGLGNDYVMADAQDAGGTNNANFSTGVDGSRPRMQMYIWTPANPDRDADLDNGVVAHEYTHGISNRYTGGPATASCLGNSEQGGEGWSDYFALMVTTNWATTTINDGAVRRGVGTYLSNQPITGTGIRRFPYSTDMSIYPLTYANLPGSAVPHGVGEIWCMMLWEMTWEIIRQDNAINPNLFTPGPTASMFGNSAALKLVSEGMRLQPCNPGFVDARNAILRADTLLFNKRYSCAIWRAFAKRGLGRLATQGSASSITDGVADFTVDASAFSLRGNLTQQQEGQNVTYTHNLTAGNCSPVTDFYITDTLPTNVTYVSGGTYNAANRTVRFNPITLASNASQSYPFTVTINNGTYFAPVTHLNETVATASIPATWSTNSTSATNWTVSSNFFASSPNAFFSPNPTAVTDHKLETAVSYNLQPVSASNYTTLSFLHRFNTEDGWDGGVVEISTNGGLTWTDLGSRMIEGKYNGSLGTGSNNPIGGRAAFTGLITSFMRTTINLSSFAGQNVNIRFRFASDDNTAPNNGGWYVDDIVIKSEPAVVIKGNFFNAGSVLQAVSDTLTRILQTVACVPITVTTQPASFSGCSGGNANLTVVAAGSNPVYQWQVNTGSGFANVPVSAQYSGANSATLVINGITAGMNGYQYRCVLSNTCTPAFNSAAATLSVGTTASISTPPSAVSACEGTNTSFTITALNPGSYQWQVDPGTGFINVTNSGPYSGATTATLSITGLTSSMNGFQYRCIIGSCPSAITSAAVPLTVNSLVTVSRQPQAAVSVCQNSATGLSIIATGTISNYQWQVSTDGGTTYTNISGATGTALTLSNVALTQNNNRYRCVISGPCNTLNSTVSVLTVNPTPVISIGTVPATACISDTAINLTGTGSGTWAGTGIQGTQFLPSLAGVGTATLTYTASNSFGCSATQNTIVQVGECPERHVRLGLPNSLTIYPNPGNGRFSLRVRSDLYKKLGVRVFASDGKLIHTQQLNGLYYDRIVPLDLSRFPGGVYYLYLYNEETGTLQKRTIPLMIAR